MNVRGKNAQDASVLEQKQGLMRGLKPDLINLIRKTW